MALPGVAAHAQVAPTRDSTPQIDASIAQQNWTSALAQLDQRIASNPRDVQARFKRGTVLAHLNRDDEAIAAFTGLTEAYPELPEPYNNLAALYAKAGRYPEARVALETATRANPDYSLAFENLGDLYLRLAAESYKQAQASGHAGGATQQRLADIQKIVAPPKKTGIEAKAAIATEASAPRVMPPVAPSPTFQFGGATGSLAIPPYTAPSH
jgi:tetratricopeptide (TPR) repeat protein